MKSKFLTAVLILCSISFSAFSQKKSTSSQPVSKVVHLNDRFTSLIIEDDLSVVLTDSNSNDVIIEGSEESVKKIRSWVSDGRLILSYLQFHPKSDVKVYVPAGLLTRVNVYGKSELTSASVLSNKNLRVTVGGEGKIHLKSVGKVTVEGTDDFDFVTASK